MAAKTFYTNQVFIDPETGKVLEFFVSQPIKAKTKIEAFSQLQKAFGPCRKKEGDVYTFLTNDGILVRVIMGE